MIQRLRRFFKQLLRRNYSYKILLIGSIFLIGSVQILVFYLFFKLRVHF